MLNNNLFSQLFFNKFVHISSFFFKQEKFISLVWIFYHVIPHLLHQHSLTHLLFKDMNSLVEGTNFLAFSSDFVTSSFLFQISYSSAILFIPIILSFFWISFFFPSFLNFFYSGFFSFSLFLSSFVFATLIFPTLASTTFHIPIEISSSLLLLFFSWSLFSLYISYKIYLFPQYLILASPC